jgi:IS30 family transposase
VRVHVPYVCNACPTIDKCTLLKTFYDAEKAHLKSHQVISESRSGLSTSEEEIARLNRIITPLVKQGHSIHEIYITHQDELMCSEKTIYNYIDDCLLEVRNIDLPRKVRFRARRKKPEFKVDKGCRIGRSYKEFEAFMEKNPDTAVVQMDSVIGTVGGKCLLTIHFVESSLMLAFLRDANTAKSVSDIFDNLYQGLGDKEFENIFRLCLADNGSEFSNPSKIEFDKKGVMRTRLFYCDPQAPFQKGSAERNHEFIRRFIPKGKSLDGFTQADISLMMDHINSYTRESLGNKAPYDMLEFLYGSEVLDLLGCRRISPNDVTLNRSIFRKENGDDDR